jgi:hypothetical protein
MEKPPVLDYEPPPAPEQSRVSASIANANSGRGAAAAVGVIVVVGSVLVMFDWKNLSREAAIATLVMLATGLYLLRDGIRVLRRTKL